MPRISETRESLSSTFVTKPAGIADGEVPTWDAGTSTFVAGTGGGGLDAATYMHVVNAGSNLSTARPTGAGAVYWMFNVGTDVGTGGANVVNGQTGDLYYVAGA